jgi:hypothetical protein
VSLPVFYETIKGPDNVQICPGSCGFCP